MNKFAIAMLAGVAMSLTLSVTAQAAGKTVGVSWSNFQGERWKTDEAAIKSALEEAGNTYISADAQSSAAKQLTDVEALISQGADALLVIWLPFHTLSGRLFLTPRNLWNLSVQSASVAVMATGMVLVIAAAVIGGTSLSGGSAPLQARCWVRC